MSSYEYFIHPKFENREKLITNIGEDAVNLLGAKVIKKG